MTKIMKQILTYLLVVLVWIYVAAWLFNHINAWIGIGTIILGLFIILHKLDKDFKKQIKNND